jgi:hypothetical protein
VKINYVLVDYENVQPEGLSALAHDHFKVIVFVGARQTSVSFEMAAALQRMCANAEYVKVSSVGPNALDFHIAFYIGQLAAKEPNACFHIISKDTGFDPLIAHLKTKKIFSCRSQTIGDIPSLQITAAKPPPAKTPSAKPPSEKLDLTLTHLRKFKAAKPRTVKTLSSTIASLFQKKLSEKEIAALLKEMEQRGYITINATKVTYSLPS